jgi:hypothetical protein
MGKKVCIYFVASPLHYLAARKIARTFEDGSRQFLVYYKKLSIESFMKKEEWDVITYMPWPRFDPLPGLFGRLRRIRENLKKISALIDNPQEINFHCSEYDSEAINYFVYYLPNRFPNCTVRFRILPDGILNINRYPLTLPKLAWHYLRKLRRIVAPELNYTFFLGDRIGTDATFIDRIYTLKGFTHKYDPQKVVELSSLVSFEIKTEGLYPQRALVISQYLVSMGLMSKSDMNEVSKQIHDWLINKGIKHIDYKSHHRDSSLELFFEDYHLLKIDEPLECYMAKNPYFVVVGIYSTALFTAKQIYGGSSHVVSFGVNRVRFKDPVRKQDIVQLMKFMDIEIYE